MAFSRRKIGVLLALGLLAIAAISAYKIQAMLQRGETVFWLAELWAPADFLSIGLVTCIEFMVGPAAPAAPAEPVQARKKAPRRR